MSPERHLTDNGEHLTRVRRICSSLPGVSEKLSHGEPTFFVNQKVFAMVANNHHHDGHIAVWIPAEPGLQQVLIRSSARKYFKPPFVGVRGWVGVELAAVDDEELALHIRNAWLQIAPKKSQSVISAQAV